MDYSQKTLQRILDIQTGKKFGLTRLAREIGVTNTTIHNWRNGASEPNFRNFQKLLEIHKRDEDFRSDV
jgi:transcriptional regulator with XRE-family HTH domain